MRSHENAIEFLDSETIAALTLSKQRYITRLKNLAKTNPDDVYIKENQDGTVFATIPVAWIKITPTRKLNEKQMEAARASIAKINEHKTTEDRESPDYPA